MKKKKNTKQKTVPKKEVAKEDMQFFWLVILISLIIVVVVAGPFAYRKIFNEFEYGGVKFEKIKQGDLVFYHGVFPIIYQGQLSSIHNVYFRTDPRKNEILINTQLGLSREVIVSLAPGVEECREIALAQPQLGSFIGSFPFVRNLTSATTNETIAQAMDTRFADCGNASLDRTVIIIQKSETPSIELGDRSSCYVLNVGECLYLETVERYILAAMAQINNVSIS